MILEDTTLRELCSQGALTPWDPRLVQPASVDIRLGRSFITQNMHEIESIDLARPGPEAIGSRVTKPLYRSTCDRCGGTGMHRMLSGEDVPCSCVDGYRYDDAGKFVIHPGECVLGETLERIRVPDDVVMVLHGKSSIGRLFVIPHAEAGYFDPGWDGVGTLEIVNLSRVPVVLRPGLPFLQSTWMRLERPAAKPYRGRYQGSTSVVGSRYSP